MNDIVRDVDNYQCMSTKPSFSVAASPTHGLSTDKKTIPDLDSFSGQDEDFYAWHDSTVNKLGQAGLS